VDFWRENDRGKLPGYFFERGVAASSVANHKYGPISVDPIEAYGNVIIHGETHDTAIRSKLRIHEPRKGSDEIDIATRKVEDGLAGGDLPE
jgi:hypothetical protein